MMSYQHPHKYTKEDDEFIFTAVTNVPIVTDAVRNILMPHFPDISYEALKSRCYALISGRGEYKSSKKSKQARSNEAKAKAIERSRYYYKDDDPYISYVTEKVVDKNNIKPNIARPLWFNDEKELLKRAGAGK